MANCVIKYGKTVPMVEYTQEVLCSSPTGSVIEISTDEPHNEIFDLKESGTQSQSYNPYSYQAAETLFNGKNLRETLTKSDSIEILNQDHEATDQQKNLVQSLEVSETVNESSGLFEVSQTEFLNSQKAKLINSPSPILASSQQFQALEEEDDDNEIELKSAQTPIESSINPHQDIIQSSSPLATNHYTPHHTKTDDSLVPSAQLTSFRMQSPIRINLTPKRQQRLNLSVTQESFSIPNLISPTKVTTPQSSTSKRILSSPSIYSTAKQLEFSSPHQSPQQKQQYELKKTSVRFNGVLSTKIISPFNKYQTKIIPMKRNINETQDTEIPDSSEDEDDSNISIIEVTRTVKKPASKNSVLQVESSPGFKTPQGSSPITSPSIKKKSDDAGIDDEEDELNTLGIDGLRKLIIEYGLKPARSKLKMIESIREVRTLLKEDTMIKLSQSQNITNSQNLIKTDIFQILNDAILLNSKLLEKISTFEPIKSFELENFLKDQDITINPDTLKEWCDNNSICIIDEVLTTTNE